MANTTTSNVPAEVNNFYDRLLLERAVPAFVHNRWGQMRDIPRNAGTKVIKFRRYGNLSAATTALTEGITPTADQLSTTEITSTVAQYGAYVTVTDVLDFTSQDPVLVEATELQGDQMGDTMDQLTRDVLVAGTSVSYGGNATSRATVDSSDKIDATALRTAVKTLKTNDAKRITQMVNAGVNISTQPVDRAFIAIVHPATTYDLRSVSGFLPVEQYSSQAGVLPNEVGSYEEIRFIETTNAKIFTGAGSGSIDVYATLILGMNAYGISRISGESVKTYRKPFGSGGSLDPLDQRATVGWKATHVATILNDNFMTRIEHAVT